MFGNVVSFLKLLMILFLILTHLHTTPYLFETIIV